MRSRRAALPFFSRLMDLVRRSLADFSLPQSSRALLASALAFFSAFLFLSRFSWAFLAFSIFLRCLDFFSRDFFLAFSRIFLPRRSLARRLLPRRLHFLHTLHFLTRLQPLRLVLR